MAENNNDHHHVEINTGNSQVGRDFNIIGQQIIYPTDPPPVEAFGAYLNRASAFVQQQIRDSLLAPDSLQADGVAGAVTEAPFVEVWGTVLDHHETDVENPQESFPHFQAALKRFGARVLLLGVPGGGKTTTLFNFAREAYQRRLEDTRQILPILAPIVNWNAHEAPPLWVWLSKTTGIAVEALQTLAHSNQVLLLLDGLDELGESRPVDPEKPEGEKFDPRERFIHQANQLSCPMVISCRVADYRTIKTQSNLDGAILLRTLSNEQMARYLHDTPDLWTSIQHDAGLQAELRVPLLLKLVKFAFRDKAAADLKAIADLREGALRDVIFNAYLEERYKHEAHKRKLIGETMPFKYEELRAILERAAFENAESVFREENVLTEKTTWSGERVCDAAAYALEKIGTPEALEAVRRWRKAQRP